MQKLCKKIANSKHFEKFSVTTIIVSIIVFAISTEIKSPQLQKMFYNISLIFGVIFLAEYCLRIISKPKKIKAILHPLMIIDIIVIISIFYPVHYNFIILRAISLLKLVRIFKMEKYKFAIQAIRKAVALEKEALILTCMFFATVIMISSTLMYIIEREYGEFYSWPRCIYWAIITGSGVGYGDIVPHTGVGRVIASLTALFGLLSYSMITVIFASGFTEIIRKNNKKIK
jgi:voltage-gated potassium channel